MKVVFWMSLTIILYVYAGYPLALAMAAWRARPSRRDDHFFPTVSLVIAAYNEEAVIREKLENSLALDYPQDRLEIVVASDGSTDATNDIVQGFADRGVVLHAMVPRGGKTQALNRVIPKTQGAIIVLSDANTMYRGDAIRKLVRHFSDPTVGAVSGDVRLVNAADSHARAEGFYYRYERQIQIWESRLGAIIGADGAMYAVDRERFRSPSDTIILDDFVISMTVARLGYRVLYEPAAVAIERGTQSSGEEFQRKVRIVAGGIQALKQGEGLPRLQQPILLFSYISHKLLRWLVPCFLVALLVASLTVVRASFFYQLALLGQVLFYGIGFAYTMNVMGLRRYRWGAIPYYFCLVNGAAFIGLCRGLLGIQKVTWQRTRR